MRPVVIDANVAVKWVFDESNSAAAHRLLRDCEELHAPAHWLAEAATALWAKTAFHRELSQAESLVRIEFLAGVPVRITPLHEIIVRAGEVAHALAVTVYDTLYIAVAERLDLILVTADRKLFDAASRDPTTRSLVRWIDSEES